MNHVYEHAPQKNPFTISKKKNRIKSNVAAAVEEAIKIGKSHRKLFYAHIVLVFFFAFRCFRRTCINKIIAECANEKTDFK